MTGTPAKKMKWKFISQTKTAGMTIKIAYPSSISRSVLKDQEEIPYNKWLKADKNPEKKAGYSPIEQKFCGENRYIGVENILEFYL